jgi:hypothetical protein
MHITEKLAFKRLWIIILIFLMTGSIIQCASDTPTRSSEPLLRSEDATPKSDIRLTMTATQVVMPTSDYITPTIISTVDHNTLTSGDLYYQCPHLTKQSQTFSWSQGSILFSKGEIIEEARPNTIYTQPGIWAISANGLNPRLVHASYTGARISPDGTTLLNIARDVNDATQEAIFYEIRERREVTRVNVPYDYWFREWLQDGRVQFRNIVERTERVGETRDIYIFDPDTKEVERLIKKLDLPDFAFRDWELDRGLFQGYESSDPTGQLILYTAKKNNSDGFEVRLYNLKTDEILWRHDTKYLADATPEWSQNGSHVLFIVSIPITSRSDSWWKIISLTREGKVEELPPQPFPFLEDGQLNHYSRSPDGQYLFYTALQVDNEKLHSRIRAFILNRHTGEIGEICDAKTSFLASVPAHDAAGHWLPENQFIYRVIIEKEGQLAQALRILDIPSWKTKTIYEAEAGQGINVLGWTPVEIP